MARFLLVLLRVFKSGIPLRSILPLSISTFGFWSQLDQSYLNLNIQTPLGSLSHPSRFILGLLISTIVLLLVFCVQISVQKPLWLHEGLKVESSNQAISHLSMPMHDCWQFSYASLKDHFSERRKLFRDTLLDSRWYLSQRLFILAKRLSFNVWRRAYYSYEKHRIWWRLLR